jgi:hypothetical protein
MTVFKEKEQQAGSTLAHLPDVRPPAALWLTYPANFFCLAVGKILLS